jgi:adenylate cyclase
VPATLAGWTLLGYGGLVVAAATAALAWPGFALATRLALVLVAVIAATLCGLAAYVLRTRAAMERRLERELGRYLSREVARAILRGKVDRGNPQKRTVTVLFCDLRGFTFLCERERPEDVVEILDTFFQGAFAAVQKRGGTINKILGDGMLALFNAPDDLPGHAGAALDAAEEIMRIVHDLRGRGGVWTHLACGIGLDTGEVVAGPVGSTDRAEYTAIGSPVNRAARLQSLGERESHRVILSEATRRAIGPRRRKLGVLGEFELKGFAAPERAYYLPISRRPG